MGFLNASTHTIVPLKQWPENPENHACEQEHLQQVRGVQSTTFTISINNIKTMSFPAPEQSENWEKHIYSTHHIGSTLHSDSFSPLAAHFLFFLWQYHSYRVFGLFFLKWKLRLSQQQQERRLKMDSNTWCNKQCTMKSWRHLCCATLGKSVPLCSLSTE